MKRNTITIIELVIVLCVVVIVIKVWTYKKPPKQISSNGEMVLIEGYPTGDFYIGKYEVTNKEYCQYAPTHKGKWSDDSYPVETVSWDDAMAYCQWLSNKTGKNYRLPTESEWEYACRAGTKTNYYWGDKMDGAYCWYEDNSGDIIHPVGEKKPNACGLYDMSGNVWEWCSDYWPNSCSKFRVIRGGSWFDCADNCQSQFSNYDSPTYRFYGIGFRIVRSP